MNVLVRSIRYISAVIAAVIVLTDFSVLNAQSESYSWNSVAIGGGGFVTGIITSKKEQGLLYARTDVGGAYRWDAANSRWIPLLDWVSDNELGYLGVESLAIDPVDANKVYMLVGTSYFNNGKTAILRSTDYGNTFQITDVTNQFKAHGNGMGRQTGEKLAIDPNLTSTLYTGTRANGLFRSTDSGASWSRVTTLDVTTTPNANGISFVILDPSTGSAGNATQTIICGVSRTTNNLFITTNGGTSFQEITGGPALMPHRALLTSNRDLYITYAAAEGPWNIEGAGSIWKYSLASSTWTNVTPSGFSGAFGGISVDPNNPARMVASSVNTYQSQEGSWGDRIFLSTNGGTSWTDVVARGFQRDENGVTWVEGHAIHWAGSVEFDPFNTNKAWIISGNGVFRTDDINATTNIWKFVVNGMEETVPLDIVSIPNGPLASVIGDYDGFIHEDVTSYSPIHSPQMGSTSGIAYASLNPKILLRTGSKLYLSTNRGLSWTETTQNGDKGNVSISSDGKVFLHSPDGSSTTYRSTNSGSTWTTVTGLSISTARTVADPINPKKFYAYNNSNGTVYVSTNGGSSFTAAGSAGTGGSKVIRVTPFREGDIWIPLHGGGLTRSTNSAETFNKINGVTYCGAVGFGKNKKGTDYPTVYIWGTVGGITGIYRSIDEGATWQRVNDDAHEYGGPANGQFVIGDMNIFGRVYMSTAGRGIVYGESNQTCVPDDVSPQIVVNSGAAQELGYVSVDQGATLKLKVVGPAGGSWSWTGPGNFSAATSEVTLDNIDVAASGTYIGKYTNANGCESAFQPFLVSVVAGAVKVQSITVRGMGDISQITEDGGTLQMIAEVLPENAANKTVTWSIVEGGANATISSEGLVTATGNGTAKVRAAATDGSGVAGEKVITITNQVVTSVEDPDGAEFIVYPNPSHTNISVRGGGVVKSWLLYDSRGILMKSGAALRDDTISMEQLCEGMYHLIIFDPHGKQYHRRVIKK